MPDPKSPERFRQVAERGTMGGMRWLMLTAGIALAVAGCADDTPAHSSQATHPTTSSTPSSPSSPSTSTTQSKPPPKHGRSAYLAQIHRESPGMRSTRDSTLMLFGQTACELLGNGTSPARLIRTTVKAGDYSADQATVLVRAARQRLC